MYGYDPFELAQPPELIKEEPEEEIRDYHDLFWEEAIERGRYVSGDEFLHTQICRFNKDGEHITMAKDCPHFNIDDEEGKRIKPGWTVQSG
jgi:hypothetical protein